MIILQGRGGRRGGDARWVWAVCDSEAEYEDGEEEVYCTTVDMT